MNSGSGTAINFRYKKSLWDHPFKTSVCLREWRVSPYADGQKVTVHIRIKNPLQEDFAGMPMVGVKNCENLLTSLMDGPYLLQFVSCKICWIAWRGSIWNAHVSLKKTAKCNCEVSYQNRPQKCYWKPRTRLLLKVNDHSGFKPRGDQFWVNWDFLNENSVSFLSLDSGNITSLHCKIASLLHLD